MKLPLLMAQMSAELGDVETFWSGFDSDQRFVLVIIGVCCLTGVLIVIGCVAAGVWASIREKQIEADLKRDMLDRGMTAEEIEKVIQSTPLTGLDRWVGSWCKKK